MAGVVQSRAPARQNQAAAEPLTRVNAIQAEGIGPMLGWVLTLLTIALMAAAFGIGSMAGTAVSLAGIVAALIVVVLALSLVAGLLARRRPPAV
jgi:uncharacterized membrane protein YtjA (UPF0391 family)